MQTPSVSLKTPANHDVFSAPVDPSAAQSAGVDDSGNWAAHLVVAGLAPGSYVLVATCDYSRAFTAWYTEAPVTVIA